jgi:hypothetical protein
MGSLGPAHGSQQLVNQSQGHGVNRSADGVGIQLTFHD